MAPTDISNQPAFFIPFKRDAERFQVPYSVPFFADQDFGKARVAHILGMLHYLFQPGIVLILGQGSEHIVAVKGGAAPGHDAFINQNDVRGKLGGSYSGPGPGATRANDQNIGINNIFNGKAQSSPPSLAQVE